MAPQLALDALEGTRSGGRVLDPMCGSGTVLRAAADRSLPAIGRDVDPLAVLMSRVATTDPDSLNVREAAAATAKQALELLEKGEVRLPWLDDQAEAVRYVKFWYGATQELQLRALVNALAGVCASSDPSTRDVLKLAISRTIVRKEQGASLARDVSHSRPHRVTTTNSFDVIGAFTKSVDQILAAISVPAKRPSLSSARGRA